MAKCNEKDTSGLGLGKGILKTFKQTLDETPIGNLPAQTFRPTEAEKLVLLNVDDMTQQGRSVTQQDAINVPQEKMEELELNKDQLESAYKQLINIRLIQVEPNQTIIISPEGAPVVEELKKAEAQKAEQEPKQPEMPQGDMGMGDMGMPSGPEGAFGAGPSPNTPMEGINLLRYLNDMSKLLEDTNQDVFTVYKVQGRNIPEVYYGFCRGTSDEAIKSSFFANKGRPGDDGRGVVKLINANGGTEGLEFDVVDRVEDEEKALLRRNEYREEDEHSVTGASYFPATLYKSVQTKHPDVFKQHQERQRRIKGIRSAKTANDVYQQDGFAEADIERAIKQHGFNSVVDDLNNLNPKNFSQKYNIQLRLA